MVCVVWNKPQRSDEPVQKRRPQPALGVAFTGGFSAMANLGVHYKAVCSLSTCKVADELCAGQEQQTPVCSTPLCKKGKQRSVSAYYKASANCRLQCAAPAELYVWLCQHNVNPAHFEEGADVWRLLPVSLSKAGLSVQLCSAALQALTGGHQVLMWKSRWWGVAPSWCFRWVPVHSAAEHTYRIYYTTVNVVAEANLSGRSLRNNFLVS